MNILTQTVFILVSLAKPYSASSINDRSIEVMKTVRIPKYFLERAKQLTEADICEKGATVHLVQRTIMNLFPKPFGFIPFIKDLYNSSLIFFNQYEYLKGSVPQQVENKLCQDSKSHIDVNPDGISPEEFLAQCFCQKVNLWGGRLLNDSKELTDAIKIFENESGVGKRKEKLRKLINMTRILNETVSLYAVAFACEQINISNFLVEGLLNGTDPESHDDIFTCILSHVKNNISQRPVESTNEAVNTSPSDGPMTRIDQAKHIVDHSRQNQQASDAQSSSADSGEADDLDINRSVAEIANAYDLFCLHGADLPRSKTNPDHVESPSRYNTATRKSPSRKTIVICVLGTSTFVAIVVAIGVGSFFYLEKRRKQNRIERVLQRVDIVRPIPDLDSN